MAAVPIFVWNGTAWQETGPTIPANPIKYQASAPSSPSTGDIWVDSDGDVTTGSQQFQRFRFVASGGETTISGADANGAVLAYTAGLEQVVLNGAVLVRGHDYTATTGTTITGLSPALVASDVLEVFSFIAFTVANTYTQAQVDGLLADYAGLRLLVPTSAVNGTVGTSGVVTFSGVSSVSLNGCFSSTYQNYKVYINWTHSTGTAINIRLRLSGTDYTSSDYYYSGIATNHSTATISSLRGSGVSSFASSTNMSTSENFVTVNFASPNTTATTKATFELATSGGFNELYGGVLSSNNQNDGFTLYPSSGTITGTIRVYGLKN